MIKVASTDLYYFINDLFNSINNFYYISLCYALYCFIYIAFVYLYGNLNYKQYLLFYTKSMQYL